MEANPETAVDVRIGTGAADRLLNKVVVSLRLLLRRPKTMGNLTLKLGIALIFST